MRPPTILVNSSVAMRSAGIARRPTWGEKVGGEVRLLNCDNCSILKVRDACGQEVSNYEQTTNGLKFRQAGLYFVEIEDKKGTKSESKIIVID